MRGKAKVTLQKSEHVTCRVSKGKNNLSDSSASMFIDVHNFPTHVEKEDCSLTKMLLVIQISREN